MLLLRHEEIERIGSIVRHMVPQFFQRGMQALFVIISRVFAFVRVHAFPLKWTVAEKSGEYERTNAKVKGKNAPPVFNIGLYFKLRLALSRVARLTHVIRTAELFESRAAGAEGTQTLFLISRSSVRLSGSI